MSTYWDSHSDIYHVEVIINMDFISPVPCPKDAPLQLIHNIDHHLQLSLMETYQSPEKSLDAFSTKALRRIVGVRCYDDVTNASILTRTGQPPLTTTIRKLLLSAFGHLPSATRHPSHRHSRLHPTCIMAPPKRTTTTPLGRPNRQRHTDAPE